MVTSVMIVDDHQLMREVLGHLLSLELDIEVVAAAADATSALVLAQEFEPDVVLMDVDLPGVDGITATRTLLAMLPETRVIMLSASCTRALVSDALLAGACGYLTKGDEAHFLTDGVRDAARGGHPMARLAVAMLS